MCDRLTHWKQDLLLFDAPVDVRAGDELIGTLVIRQNPVWRRHYLLDLTVRLADGRFELGKTYLMWR